MHDPTRFFETLQGQQDITQILVVCASIRGHLDRLTQYFCSSLVLSLGSIDISQVVVRAAVPWVVFYLLFVGLRRLVQFPCDSAVVFRVDHQLLTLAGVVAQLQRLPEILSSPHGLSFRATVR